MQVVLLKGLHLELFMQIPNIIPKLLLNDLPRFFILLQLLHPVVLRIERWHLRRILLDQVDALIEHLEALEMHRADLVRVKKTGLESSPFRELLSRREGKIAVFKVILANLHRLVDVPWSRVVLVRVESERTAAADQFLVVLHPDNLQSSMCIS